MTNVASTASTGPAGGHFEGHVGAAYLLAMLVGAEARGLPGASIDRVACQRAAEGHPLDDVVIYAHDAHGNSAVLEVQVKKGMTFAPGDKVFREVVGQIAEAARKPEFWTTRHELGVAISRTSHNIDGPYQDVLTWARQLGDATTFIERINRPGSANDRMRSFVDTFRSHLKDAGAAHDDQTVWQLLRRLHILVFDFTATGSASAELARERAIRALHPEDAARAGNLWGELTELAIRIAAAGGDRRRDELRSELVQMTFRLAPDRHNLPALSALAEASGNALADIDDRVGGTMLTRYERIGSVHDSLDRGRYVEIRGDAGVGKSAVMKHFAVQAWTQSQVVVLSPGRTIPKGWLAMRAVLNFDGSAHDLLSDLAASGGAIIFIDSLDFYREEERLTVIDLVREAAKVPGLSVIATARRDFGVGEPSWLPVGALDQLGRADPVFIDELSDGETEELRSGAPTLAALLSDQHPARPVARNLFRLSRLASRPSDAPMPRTEAEMAEQWWQSADGLKDGGHRERARVLASLAEQAIDRTEILSVKGQSAVAVDALVTSGTLRDLNNDRVIFRHDVLREWAIANFLFADATALVRLPLDRPAPPDLARGVELAARLAIERTADGDAWHSFFTELNKEGVNPSWSRAVLLALVRSEIASEALNKASAHLLADRARILRELIRIVMAVESVSAARCYGRLGIDPRMIPSGFSVPNGPSWLRLILWLLKIGANLPAAAIPEVVALYTNWSVVVGAQDPCARYIVRWFHQWLMEINRMPEGEEPRRPFNGEIDQIGRLAEDLQTGFLLLASHAPDLAAAYLNSLKEHPYGDRVREGILKFRGTLAQGAPKELAELTAELLLPKQGEEDEDRQGPLRRPFGHADLNFVPVSPAQGPFLELLIHTPQHGLPLIRRLVDYAIFFYTGGRDFGNDAMTVLFPDGSATVFPWHRSYPWSREYGSGPSALTSALMALEAWSHQRIEAGEPIEKVIADIIGAPNPPAAYLLVIVDVLLSHWPASSAAAIPFLACPELLCLDQQRSGGDNIEVPDIFGLKHLQKEPLGLASIESLRARPSRRLTLGQLLDFYAREEFTEQRKPFVDLLARAAARLGLPTAQMDLGDAAFMAVHALNRIDPENWRKVTVETANGSAEDWEYVSPQAENGHLKPLQDESREHQLNGRMRMAIVNALNNPARSSPAFVAAAVKWAQEVADKPCADESEQRLREEAIVIAAVIGIRDGDEDLVAAHGKWIRETFGRAFGGKNDPVHRTRTGMRFNPFAIAFVGTVLLLRNGFATDDVRTLLEAAGDDNPAAAQGFAYVAAALASIDERLPRAVLRCAFAASVKPHRRWGLSDEEYAAPVVARRREVAKVIEAELAWLSGSAQEPGWPAFEREPAYPSQRYAAGRSRRERREDDKTPELYTDHQAAALWLGKAGSIFDVAKRPWLRDIVRAYSGWTSVANGSELEQDEDAERTPDQWNEAYFGLLAHCLPGLTIGEIDAMGLDSIMALPGEAFMDVLAIFVRKVDTVYFSDAGLWESQAVHIRTVLARKLMKTRDWEWKRRELSSSITTRLGPSVAVLFFNDFGGFREPPTCYLLEKGIDGLGPFLPLLGELTENGPFLFAATTLLNLLEVSPKPAHLPLIVAAGKTWFASHPRDTEFWVENGVGRRMCIVIEAIVELDPGLVGRTQIARKEIEGFLGVLIGMGVSEAHLLEETLRQVQ